MHAYKHKGLFCIFSNPCFEIWYVLHFRDAPFGKNAGYVKSMVKDLVKDKYPDYCETVDIFNYIFDKQAEALRRAKQLHKSHKDVHRTVYCHDCNPFTNIYEFIDYVESAKIY